MLALFVYFWYLKNIQSHYLRVSGKQWNIILSETSNGDLWDGVKLKENVNRTLCIELLHNSFLSSPQKPLIANCNCFWLVLLFLLLNFVSFPLLNFCRSLSNAPSSLVMPHWAPIRYCFQFSSGLFLSGPHFLKCCAQNWNPLTLRKAKRLLCIWLVTHLIMPCIYLCATAWHLGININSCWTTTSWCFFTHTQKKITVLFDYSDLTTQ